ncbi:methylated-DNA--[protein]-cysteine S-methyltransferase [Actinomyces bowdenii]|uniref:methylated-DNA--[protein]-cysteine S-methyltransferase n=1 Tax=Actinomyces bowdenii TaxID=131109 RepID=A0A3P1V8F0_9ACTO|nr:methylated-DNA--[protein]-cysteine S-methyltransferase [Actinomyces bowdenii]MBO3723837.1 methylated-DNA--[protein]-cysteine S-methyltransferase [Actinomyces bowdenii]RRD29926.1 methylated-DNA--[protein]-cysteine S-methyltransferase [Actinomyces bowdenii]
MHYYSHYHSPLGPMTMASDGKHLTGLWFDGQKHDRATLDEQAVQEEDLPIFQETRQWLDAYFGGPAGGPQPSPQQSSRPSTAPLTAPALAVDGSPFRRMVLEILRSIPSGQTMTYAQIAAQVAQRTGRERVAAQAVGGAVGRNPISLIIPCHRVVGSSGNLTGYASGVDHKRRLLEMEGADLSSMFMPGQPPPRRARAESGP